MPWGTETRSWGPLLCHWRWSAPSPREGRVHLDHRIFPASNISEQQPDQHYMRETSGTAWPKWCSEVLMFSSCGGATALSLSKPATSVTFPRFTKVNFPSLAPVCNKRVFQSASCHVTHASWMAKENIHAAFRFLSEHLNKQLKPDLWELLSIWGMSSSGLSTTYVQPTHFECCYMYRYFSCLKKYT